MEKSVIWELRLYFRERIMRNLYQTMIFKKWDHVRVWFWEVPGEKCWATQSSLCLSVALTLHSCAWTSCSCFVSLPLLIKKNITVLSWSYTGIFQLASFNSWQPTWGLGIWFSCGSNHPPPGSTWCIGVFEYWALTMLICQPCVATLQHPLSFVAFQSHSGSPDTSLTGGLHGWLWQAVLWVQPPQHTTET